MQLTDEARAQRARLETRIQQAAKIEYLYSIDEFNFFIEWVMALRDELQKSILTGKHLQEGMGLRQEDFAKGGYYYLDRIVKLRDTFQQGGVKARKQLEDFDRRLREEHDGRLSGDNE